jgi:hypothetical protein
MDIRDFWELIEQTKLESGGDDVKQADLIVSALVQMPIDEIYAYDHLHFGLMSRAYRAELWDAAHLINCLCGDDSFMDFRAWLIGQGETIYEAALDNPESLVSLIDVGQQTLSEPLLYVIQHAYEQHTGLDYLTMPQFPREKIELQGKFVFSKGMTEQETKQQLMEKFPLLYVKFSDCSWFWEMFENGLKGQSDV